MTYCDVVNKESYLDAYNTIKYKLIFYVIKYQSIVYYSTSKIFATLSINCIYDQSCN